MESLQREAPIRIWNDKGHAPLLKTEEDWIRPGELVFDSAVVYDGVTTAADVIKPDWYTRAGVLLTKTA